MHIEVNGTLTVDIASGPNPHTDIERDGGGLVRLEPGELWPLIEALIQAVDALANEANDDRTNALRT